MIILLDVWAAEKQAKQQMIQNRQSPNGIKRGKEVQMYLTKHQTGVLKHLNGDYVVIKWSNSERWFLAMFLCRKGQNPIDDVIHSAVIDGDYPIGNIVRDLVKQGYKKEYIKIFGKDQKVLNLKQHKEAVK